MKLIIRIARTELATLFYSPIAWFILIVFSFLTTMKFSSMIDSLITAAELAGENQGIRYSISEYFLAGDTSFFSSILQNLFIYIPLLTMGLFSREYASGSIKLLYSSPVRSSEMVLGKFTASVIYGIVLLIVPIIATIFLGLNIPHFEWGLAVMGLFGLFCLIIAYSAIGLFMSSLTSYQVVAAVGTLVILAALSYVGQIGQEYTFIREITYWLSISGRAMRMISGLLCSDDILYFIIVVSMFLAFTMMRISFSRKTISKVNISMKYILVVLVVVAIGYISSRPSMMAFHDFTNTKTQTLTKNSRDILDKVDGKLTITSYVNLVDGKSFNHLPRNIKNDERSFSMYTRFKPDIQLKYIYYWDTIAAPGALQNLKGNTLLEKATYMVTVFKLNNRLFKSPQEIRKIVDLSSQDNRYVRVLESSNGRKAYLRDYADNMTLPSEAEISGAIKTLTMESPVVGFVKGQGEREINKEGDRDYSSFANDLYFRYSLVNQGFEIVDVDLSKSLVIDNRINILVIADSRASFTEEKLAIIDRYIDKGGNMLILADVGRQNSMNPLIKRFGVIASDGILAQPTGDFYPNFILCNVTKQATKLNFEFEDMRNKNNKVSMNGVLALEITKDSDFVVEPLLATNKKGAWIELETNNLLEDKVEFNPIAGEVEKEYYTAVSATRKVGDREQRVLIMGDADCMSNAELTIQREGYISGNFSLITGSFRWLSNNEYPIDTRREPQKDKNINLKSKDISTIKFIFMAILPCLMLFSAIIILIKRRKK